MKALFPIKCLPVSTHCTVIPAKAGIQAVVAIEPVDAIRCSAWIPAFAGMTGLFLGCPA